MESWSPANPVKISEPLHKTLLIFSRLYITRCPNFVHVDVTNSDIIMVAQRGHLTAAKNRNNFSNLKKNRQNTTKYRKVLQVTQKMSKNKHIELFLSIKLMGNANFCSLL